IDHNHILVFCIIDTQNQNIIEINNNDLILMSCFEKVEKNMFKEIDYQMIATKYKLKSAELVSEHGKNSKLRVERVIEALRKINDPLNHCGFIACDNEFRRIILEPVG